MAKELILSEIEDLADSGAYAGTYTLSDESVALVLSWLALLFHGNWKGVGYSLTPSETDTIDTMVAECLNELMEPAEGNGMELGMIMAFAGETIPDGWLLCDGALHDTDDYPELYDAIDDVFHVDSYFFNLPDLTARAVVGDGDYVGGSYAVGDVGGAPVVTLTEAEMPAHTHDIVKRNTPLFGGSYARTAQASGATAQPTTSTGGDEAHENMPPFLILQWIIYAGPETT